MKKVFRNNRVVALALLTLFSVPLFSIAQVNPPGATVQAEMKYIGMMYNSPVFELKMASVQEQESFSVRIKDEYGTVLYQETILAKGFSKKFMINIDEIGNDFVYFEITSKKGGDFHSFDVQASSRSISKQLTKISNGLTIRY